METEPQTHLYELLKNFSTAMLISHRPDGNLHSRPMAIAELQPGAHAYFVTDASSPKVSEIRKDPRVHVTFQGSSGYASLSGTAAVVSDRALIERLWTEAWRVWFPNGKDDPNIVLLRVDPTVGEYWDNRTPAGISYLFEGLKAYLQGRRPEIDDAQHAEVRIGA